MYGFSDTDWGNVLASLQTILGDVASKELASKPIAKLIASISYISGGEDPDRFAVSNVLTYYAALKDTKTFGHRESDNEYFARRLQTLKFGKNSNPELVQKGLDLLQLTQISNYVKDQDKDWVAGKYNPVSAGVVDAPLLINAFTASVNTTTAYSGVMVTNQATVGLWS